MNIKALLLLVLLPFSSVSYGYQQEIDAFFTLYQQGKIEASIDRLYESNQYASAITDQITQVKTQLAGLHNLVGDINFKTKIAEYSVGGLFVHVTYLITYDRQPVRFEFQFFKVNDGWRIYSMSYDDNIDEEIQRLAREAALRPDQE